MQVVKENTYREQKEKYDLGLDTCLYSPALTNAILAMGSIYSAQSHAEIRSFQPSEFFARRARALLEIEVDSPTYATIQTLVTLSAYEMTQARDSRGERHPKLPVRPFCCTK